MSKGRKQKFIQTFRISSCERGVFFVFLDLGMGLWASKIKHLIEAQPDVESYDIFGNCLWRFLLCRDVLRYNDGKAKRTTERPKNTKKS